MSDVTFVYRLLTLTLTTFDCQNAWLSAGTNRNVVNAPRMLPGAGPMCEGNFILTSGSEMIVVDQAILKWIEEAGEAVENR